MHYELYVSSATQPFSKAELVDLLELSRLNNKKLGLTGMLLYKDGNFMQVLEGEESVIQPLMNSIERDPRHRGILRLLKGETEHRQFPDWAMGFRDLSSMDVAGLEGYSEFLNTPLTGAEFAADPGKAQRLLLMFKRTM